MADELSSSCSVARLRERAQGTLKINLSEMQRERRISSLRELRRSVVESKRSEYLRRLEGLLQQPEEEDGAAAAGEEEDVSTETDMDVERESDDGGASDDEVALCDVDAILGGKWARRQDRLVRDVGQILTWPEFLLGTAGEMREEAEALKQSLMFVRPAGQRVLLVVNKFWATEYRKDGTKRRSFRVQFTKGPTILDCVVNDHELRGRGEEGDLRYFVLDVMLYNGCMLAHSDTECRVFFIRSRMEEAGADYERPRFTMVDYHECTTASMRDAYYRAAELPYERDSLVFVDRRASYIGGYNPNWLCWRDGHTSQYAQEKPGHVPARVLCDAADHMFKTMEGLPVGQVPRRLQRKSTYVTTIMVKEVDIEQLLISRFMAPRASKDARRPASRGSQPADSLRKVVRRYMMANQQDFDPEAVYNCLADAVGGV